MSRRGRPGTGGGAGRLRRWPAPVLAFLAVLSASPRSLASTGADAPATSIISAAAAAPPACLLRLAARDGADRTLFETVAAATATPGLAVAPLHPLERGGVRWSSLTVLPLDGTGPGLTGWGVTSVSSIVRERDQVTLQAPGLPSCGSPESQEQTTQRVDAKTLTPGAAVLVARGREGFRKGIVGGRVERVLELPGDHRLLLVRLLDERGADPALVFHPTGALLGSVLPVPVGSDPSLATVVLEPLVAPAATTPALALAVRDAIAISPRPSALATIPGLVSQALRLTGPARFDRGLVLLDEVSRQAGTTVSLLLEKGVMEFGAGRIASAVDDFRVAAGKDPACHLARYNLGIALGTEGKYLDAASALRSALDLKPEHGRTRFQLALALRALGRTSEARQELENLARIDPVLAGELRAILGA